MATVLIVDDEVQILRALQINLNARGYSTVTAFTGQSALEQAAQHPVDIIILDLGLPDLDGVEVIRRLRRWNKVPILVLSARHGSEDKILALDAGADDYVTKPFGMDELLARLRAALRRGAPGDAPVVKTDVFTVNLPAKQVTRRGVPVRLTPTEWNILELLVRNSGALVTHEDILTRVWGPGYADETAYLRVYLAQLRRKLELDPANPRHLLTETGLGYRFQE
ncbi:MULTISPECIES: response regulator [Micrococcaceae]|jgi:two-component system, OmpR family, KDP operon response regulator KdpE|uniref:response regulator n=1 Tax=Micrococcaceae TaxID=1268 RepID=UPI0012FBA283|nr:MULTISPECIES: response regulator [Pseudarthrobacter]MEA3550320.1 response regulator [Pseudarthrobacter sp. C1]MUU72503.1 response regulator [Pseudarthrobacter sp. GA104]WPU08532.1 response regulator [Pseudarthrobacter oxydans]HET7782275.1 response regulator [Arthrobacter sp.]